MQSYSHVLLSSSCHLLYHFLYVFAGFYGIFTAFSHRKTTFSMVPVVAPHVGGHGCEHRSAQRHRGRAAGKCQRGAVDGWKNTHDIWLVVWNHGFLFSRSAGNFMIPTDELLFFRGVAQPPTIYMYIYNVYYVYIYSNIVSYVIYIFTHKTIFLIA